MLALLMVYNVLVSHKVLSLHVSFFVVYISLHCVHCSFKHISLTFNECSGFLYFHSAFFLFKGKSEHVLELEFIRKLKHCGETIHNICVVYHNLPLVSSGAFVLSTLSLEINLQ